MLFFKYRKLRILISIIIFTLSSMLFAVGFNLLLIPHQLLSGGLSGVAMVIGYIFGGNIGWLYLILNVPVLIWGWYKLGKYFILKSIYSVISSSLFMQLIPVNQIADDILLGAVFGGILIGLASGLALRFGGSTGGFDIIASIITQKKDIPVGTLLFILNAVVIAFHIIFTGNWDLALFSLLAIFVVGKVIDVIHIKHLKVTAFIITNQTELMLKELLTHPRGITIIKTRGAFTSNERDMLMTVRTRYELVELKKTIAAIDKHAFVSIVETVGVIGDFSKHGQK